MPTRKLGHAFQVGDIVANRKVLEVFREPGQLLRATKYRILVLGCGHEAIVTHKTLMDPRTAESHLCYDCAKLATGKALAARKKNPDAPTPLALRPHPDREEMLATHALWDQSLNLRTQKEN